MSEADVQVVGDDRGPIGWLAVHGTPDVAAVVAEPARSLLTRAEANQVLGAIGRATDAPVVELSTVDPMLRELARDAGFIGGLRAPLVRGRGATGPRTVAEFLADADVSFAAMSVPARAARWFTTGLDRTARITARRDGVHATVVAPVGVTALPEPTAATLDTLLSLTARLGAVSGRVPPVQFSLHGTGITSGRTAGLNAGAAIMLNPMYVDARALERVRRKRDVNAVPRPHPSGVALDSTWFIDRVVVHECGHSIDQAVASGRLSDTVAARGALGRAIGVESVELALRAEWSQAEPHWAQARERIVADLSEYATTNCVELFAEAFVAWYLHEASPIAGAMEEILRARYPDLP